MVLLIYFCLFSQVKVFGVPLENLPQYNIEHGSVPRQVEKVGFKELTTLAKL